MKDQAHDLEKVACQGILRAGRSNSLDEFKLAQSSKPIQALDTWGLP